MRGHLLLHGLSLGRLPLGVLLLPVGGSVFLVPQVHLAALVLLSCRLLSWVVFRACFVDYFCLESLISCTSEFRLEFYFVS